MGQVWLGTDLPGLPSGKAALIRVCGAAVMAAGCFAAAMTFALISSFRLLSDTRRRRPGERRPCAHLLGAEGSRNVLPRATVQLTRRELDVLRLLVDGSSK